MKATRLSLSLIAALITVPALLLGAGVAMAQSTYALSGKLLSTRGTYIIIPVRGNTFNNCAGLSRGYRFGMLPTPAGTTPGMTMTRYETDTAAAYAGMMQAGPYGCVSVAATFTGPAGLSAAGATFTVPTSAFSKPFPGYTAAVDVPNQPEVVQLGTSFRIYGPPTDRPTVGDDAPGFMVMDLMAPFAMTDTIGPSMANITTTTDGMGVMHYMGTNLAPLRKLQKSAHTVQTGRAGASFTWCYNDANPPCTNILEGDNMIAKVRNTGPNKFGGTMNYLIETGPNVSTLALGLGCNIAAGMTMCTGGGLEIARLAGMGHQPTGRGYASLGTDRIMTGVVAAAHMEKIVTPPAFGGAMFQLITMLTVTAPGMGLATAATNKNVGFPWTTGTAIVMQTGSTTGAPMTATFTGRGTDTVSTTAMGLMARNIVLVAPQLARTNILSGTNTAGMGFLTLKLPEPGGAAQLLAGALALAVLGAWRSRRSS